MFAKICNFKELSKFLFYLTSFESRYWCGLRGFDQMMAQAT
jgi:hypothetical protein